MDDRTMTDSQCTALMDRLDRLERSAVTKSDVCQAVMIVQGAWPGVIVGAVLASALGIVLSFQ